MPSPNEPDQQPIFIVGPSRSGTTLMGGCLNADPDVFIAPETHFFDDLAPKMSKIRSPSFGEAERKRCEDYFLALTHRPYGEAGDPERGRMQRSQLREYASRLEPSPIGYFEAFCRLQAEALGRKRWGEKTPRHVFRISDIVKQYPQAKFICMLRDPRAVVASYRDFKKGPVSEIDEDPGSKEALENEQERVRLSYHVVIISLMWKAVAKAAFQARERFGDQQIWIQRYEDFVEQPEATLMALSDWMSIEYSSAMITDVPIGTSSYRRFESDAGVTTAAVSRWREKMSPAEVDVVQMCCGSMLTKLGYERMETRASRVAVLGIWAGFPLAVFSAFRANRARLGGTLGYLWRRAQAFFCRS